MEKRREEQTRIESKTRAVVRINSCLSSGDYSSALVLLRGAVSEFPNDAELSNLEKLAQDGVKRRAEADRLITESQELFARQQSAEAIQLLREAHELDKNNSLARSILANAMVEHAHSIVETDWLEAETLTNQALNLNPAHPTAKTILSRIVDLKERSSVEDWVAQARKLQSSGDLFAALGWVAEGLAVHPRDPKLLQIQDEIQRDQGARRRQSRRGDVQDLRRLELEIDDATDAAAKQALAERIQGMAAKYWTDGEILSRANSLLQRLGLASKESSTALPRSKGAAVIFHVPRPSAPGASPADLTRTPPSKLAPRPVSLVRAAVTPVPPSNVSPKRLPPTNAPSGVEPTGKVPSAPPEPLLPPPQAAVVPVGQASAPAVNVTAPSSPPKEPTRSSFAMPIFVSAAAMIAVAAISFIMGTHHATTLAPRAAAPIVSGPGAVATIASGSPPTTAEPSPPASRSFADTAAENVALDHRTLPRSASVEPGRDRGTLLVVAGQDNARVFLNGKLQSQLTQAGQLRLPNLELKDYVVGISKSGFQDPPEQRIRIRQGEEVRLGFNLQPQPRLASLIIHGGAPGTTVLVDQNLIGTIQPDGTLSVSTVSPGDHTVELRKAQFKPRQLKEHFDGGETISLVAADAALEPALGELKITYAPVNANVAIAKTGGLPTIVSSGVPLNLSPGTYTLTARTAERFTRSSPLEVVAGQSKILDLSLAPNGMSNWDDPGAWKHEKDSFIRRGGGFILYGVVPASGTFVFSAALIKGRLLQWVLNYTDPKNYVLFQINDNDFYRTVIRNGEKTDEVKVPDQGDKKNPRTLVIRVSPTEIVHLIRHGNSGTVLDRWAQPGVNLSLGKFGFYIPGNDEVGLSGFAYYADMNTR